MRGVRMAPVSWDPDADEIASSSSAGAADSPHGLAAAQEEAQLSPLLPMDHRQVLATKEHSHCGRRAVCAARGWPALVAVVGTATLSAVCSSVIWVRRSAAAGDRQSFDWSGGHVVSLVGPPDYCNGHPGFGAQSPRSWSLPSSTRSVCYESFHGSYNGKDMPPGGRNWCWVGMKRLGCHARLAYRLSWRELNSIAVQAGALNPPEPFLPLLDPQVCDVQTFGATRAWSPEEDRLAHEWFRENVVVLVLNLPMNRARWTFIQARLKELRIDATRVDGVDMRWEGALSSAMQEGMIPSSFDLEKAKTEAWKIGLGGILGRVGCASAHFRGQRHAMKSGKPLAVIFEDDVWPEHDFVPRLWQLVREELPCDWEAVSLSSKCPYGRCISKHLTRVQPDANEPEESCHGGVNYGFQGMLYRTERLEAMQRIWQRVVFDHDRPQCLDVDVALASISDQVAYYAVPFVQNPGFLSEILTKSSRETVDSGNPAGSSAPTCSSHAGCKGLIGDCCPTTAGVRLGCCGVERDTCGAVESGVDFVVDSNWGYSVNQIPSPDRCCGLCQKEPQCKAWTWIRDAGLGGLSPGQCWLKGGEVVSKLRKEGVVSGLQSANADAAPANAAQNLTRQQQLQKALAGLSMMEITEVMQGGALENASAGAKQDVANQQALSAACPHTLLDMEFKLESSDAWAVHADHVLSPDACCAMCNKEALCVSWTFVKDAKLPSGLPSQCWIKGGNVTGVARKEGIIAGLRA